MAANCPPRSARKASDLSWSAEATSCPGGLLLAPLGGCLCRARLGIGGVRSGLRGGLGRVGGPEGGRKRERHCRGGGGQCRSQHPAAHCLLHRRGPLTLCATGQYIASLRRSTRAREFGQGTRVAMAGDAYDTSASIKRCPGARSSFPPHPLFRAGGGLGSAEANVFIDGPGPAACAPQTLYHCWRPGCRIHPRRISDRADRKWRWLQFCGSIRRPCKRLSPNSTKPSGPRSAGRSTWTPTH